MLAIAVPVGLLIGLSLGALGGGGSILTVPALVYLLHQSPHAATTGSLVVVGTAALAGMAAHWQAGRVRVAAGATFGLLGVAGSYAGSRLSARVSPDLLLAAFAALMLLAAAAMMRRAGRTDAGAPVVDRPDDAYPRASGGVEIEPRTDLRKALTVVAAATLVGVLTGFFGVGGGFVVVPALVLALGLPMPVAVGTSLLVITVNSVTALAARAGIHVHVDWTLLAVFTGAAIAGSFAGNRIASRVDPVTLTRVFAVLLTAVAAYTAARSAPHLA